MISNIPKPSWHKPHPPKSFWQKVLTSFFGGLGFFAVAPIPGLHAFIPRPLSYFVRVTEKKASKPVEKRTELIKEDTARQINIWRESADEEKNNVVYKVQAGDSLWKIAEAKLGDGMRWIDIWTANQVAIKEPNLIFAGQELKIPNFILSRTALFKSPAPAPAVKAAKITPAGEMIKRQIISATDSIGNLSTSAAAQSEARELANQASGISDLNSQAVDLTVRTLDLGRETIQSAQTATMAWSQDAAGNIKYYTKQNGAWAPNEVNPIGNIGAIYGTQDITQTPEYKSGKIIQIASQPAPSAPAVTVQVPYGGAILNTEQQKIYEKLNETGGVAAAQYKQTILAQSPIAVAAAVAAAQADSTKLGSAVGNAISASAAPAEISQTTPTSALEASPKAGLEGISKDPDVADVAVDQSGGIKVGSSMRSGVDLGTYSLDLGRSLKLQGEFPAREDIEGFNPATIAKEIDFSAPLEGLMKEAISQSIDDINNNLSELEGPSYSTQRAEAGLAKAEAALSEAKSIAAGIKGSAPEDALSKAMEATNKLGETYGWSGFATEQNPATEEQTTRAIGINNNINTTLDSVKSDLNNFSNEEKSGMVSGYEGLRESLQERTEQSPTAPNPYMGQTLISQTPAPKAPTPAVDLESRVEAARADIAADIEANVEAGLTQQGARKTEHAAQLEKEAEQKEVSIGRPDVAPDEPSPAKVAGIDESVMASARQTAEAEAARAAEQQAAQAAAVESMTQESVSLGEEAAAAAKEAAEAPEASPAPPSVAPMGAEPGTPAEQANPGVTDAEKEGAMAGPKGGSPGYSTEQGRTSGGYATSQAEAAAREATHEAMASESKSIGSYGGGLSEGPQGGGTAGGGVGSSSGDVGGGVD